MLRLACLVEARKSGDVQDAGDEHPEALPELHLGRQVCLTPVSVDSECKKQGGLRWLNPRRTSANKYSAKHLDSTFHASFSGPLSVHQYIRRCHHSVTARERETQCHAYWSILTGLRLRGRKVTSCHPVWGIRASRIELREPETQLNATNHCVEIWSAGEGGLHVVVGEAAGWKLHEILHVARHWWKSRTPAIIP